MHFLDCAAYHLVALDFLVIAKDILCTVVPVNMAGNEIHRNLVVGTVSNEGICPCGLRGGGPTHAQA